MRSPNVTVLSYGKNPRARHHNKPQYYLARHIIDYRPMAPNAHDTPDLQVRPVPLLTLSSEVNVQSHHKSSLQSIMEKSRRSEIKMNKSVSHIEFEKLYYTELEKNKHMEIQLIQLKDANDRLHSDKKAVKDHYEEFIRQLQAEVQNSKLMESKFNSADAKRRVIEEELHRLRVEVDMLRQPQTNNEDEVVEELRERIKTLNQEKIDLLNSLQNNKTEILNLKTQINFFQNKEKEASNIKQTGDDYLKEKIRLQEIEILDLRRYQSDADNAASALRLKDSEISALKLEIDNLNLEIRKLKEQLENRDVQIVSLNSRIRSLESQKITSTTEIIREQPRMETSVITRYPAVERLSVRREPIRIEKSLSPPPTVVRTYTSSPIVKREYIDSRTGCCCCTRCDFCLNKTNNNTSNINVLDETKERYSTVRYSKPEVINSTYKVYDSIDKRPQTSVKEARSVTRYNINDNYNNYIDARSTRQAPTYSFREQNKYKTSKISIPRNQYTETEIEDVSPRGNKSLELYKYYNETEPSNSAQKQDQYDRTVVYRKPAVRVNGKHLDQNDSMEYEHKNNTSRIRLSESRNSNVFTDGKYQYGKDSHRFSEYNYM